MLFVGPVPPPISGQSIAFMETYKIFEECRPLLIDQNVSGKSAVSTVLIILRALIRLSYYLALKNVDVVYFTCSRSFRGSLFDIVLINLSSMAGAKIVNHLHGADFREFYDRCGPFYRRILAISYRKVCLSIVLLKELKTQFTDLFPQMKVLATPNFYPCELDAIEDKPQSETVRVLYLSNIMKSKGIVELLDAFDRLCRQYPGLLSLTIAGNFMDDRYCTRREIEKSVYKRLNAIRMTFGDCIFFKGFVTGGEKFDLLLSSDIFVLPSYREALPLSILEAMRAGNAIVTTRMRHLTSIISVREGITVDAGSVEALVDGLAALVEDRKRLMAIQFHNMDHARRRYSLGLYRKRMKKIFEQM